MRYLVPLLAVAACQRERVPAPPPVANHPLHPFEVNCSTSNAPNLGRDARPMCWVPPAEFTMGTPVKADRPQDGPARRVRITRGFFIDQTEVPIEAFARFVDANPDVKCPRFEESGCTAGWDTDGSGLLGFKLEKWNAQLPATATYLIAARYC